CVKISVVSTRRMSIFFLDDFAWSPQDQRILQILRIRPNEICGCTLRRAYRAAIDRIITESSDAERERDEVDELYAQVMQSHGDTVINTYRLSAEILSALRSGPLPIWVTCGGRGFYPAEERHDLGSGSTRYSARLDGLRGGAENDLSNQDWSALLSAVPPVERFAEEMWNVTGRRGRGNAMEMICGVAYTCAVGGRNLGVDGGRLEFASLETVNRWAMV
ncbi:unnamed protein product, partial [Amoebophrya sp. A25]